MKDLKELSKPLTSDQIEFRVGAVFKGKGKVWAQLLGYKDARTDMQILDDVVGAANWQLRFHEGKESVVAELGIRVDGQGTVGNGDFVWKSGNGTPGDFEGAKGAYSDAQKRAGFQWGIGRGLYDFPQIFVELFVGEYTEKDGKVYASKSLRPQDWVWVVKYGKDNKVAELTATYKNSNRFSFKQK